MVIPESALPHATTSNTKKDEEEGMPLSPMSRFRNTKISTFALQNNGEGNGSGDVVVAMPPPPVPNMDDDDKDGAGEEEDNLFSPASRFRQSMTKKDQPAGTKSTPLFEMSLSDDDDNVFVDRMSLNYDDEFKGVEEGGEDTDDDDDDDRQSSTSGDGSSTTERLHKHSTKKDAMTTFAKKESKMVYIWRFVVLAILVSTAMVFSLKVYQHTREEEIEDFRTQFYTYGDYLVNSFVQQVELRYQLMDTMSIAFTTTATATTTTAASSSSSSSNFPNVTMSNFQLLGSNTRVGAEALSVYYAPLVTDETRPQWEAYTQTSSVEQLQLESYQTNKEWRTWQDTAYGYTTAEEEEGMESSSYRTEIWTFVDEEEEEGGDGVDGPNDISSLNQVVVPSGQGRYLPIWQVSPYTSELINLDLLSSQTSSKSSRDSYLEVFETGQANLGYIIASSTGYDNDYISSQGGGGGGGSNEVVRQQVDENNLNSQNDNLLTDYFIRNGQYRHDNLQELVVGGGDTRYDKTTREYYYVENGNPVSILTYPVFGSLGAPSHREPEVVGVLTARLYWNLYFADILPPEAKGLLAVLENDWNQTYSFYVYAHTVTFLGVGDHHESDYDDIVVMTDIDFDMMVNGNPKSRSYTSTRSYSYHSNTDTNHQVNQKKRKSYRLKVYPTTDFKIEFTSRRPRHYAGAIWFLFLFTSAVFIIYDLLVEKRQHVVMDRAVKSTAVVSSLFPENVRDRLLEQQGPTTLDGRKKKKPQRPQPTKRSNSFRGGLLEDTTGSGGEGGTGGGNNAAAVPDFTDTNYDATDSPEDATASGGIGGDILGGNGGASLLASRERAIADRFQATTVMFADLAGFTRWSSNREPDQVFALLETLYQAFDNIALKRKVFKVETIGDCYLAVTGLPDPQPDHAIRIAKFALECMSKMKELVHKLVWDLGESTADLSFRVGLHSGAVTAGVLRGDKSRFQLFGDTVNTAARMESTGIAGKIQCSETTAQELRDSGKPHWLTKREDLVLAKGKGKMQTYWIKS